MITAYLSGNLPFVWKLIIGVAFVVVIVALPQGIDAADHGGPARCGGCARSRAAHAGAASRSWHREPSRSPGWQGPDARALQVRGSWQAFGSLKVLEGIAFKARGSELLSLVGPNGAGKTTLMRCIADGGERSGGTVAVFGHDIERLPPYAWSPSVSAASSRPPTCSKP